MPTRRITNADLQQMVDVITRYCAKDDEKYSFYGGGGRYCLIHEYPTRTWVEGEWRQTNAASEVSPYLSKRELHQWMDAFVKGIEHWQGQQEN